MRRVSEAVVTDEMAAATERLAYAAARDLPLNVVLPTATRTEPSKGELS